MKKNATCFFLYFKGKRKLFLSAKLMLIVLLASFIQVAASDYSPGINPEESQSVSQALSVQQNVVSGKVTDNAGVPLPGVTVIIKGTTNGMITDGDGNYSLSNVSSTDVLQFSFVGMRSKDVTVGNQTVINATLEEDMIGIEEVVAVGYGVQKKTTVTGAISTVKGDELAEIPVPNISQALAGKLAGVSMRPNGGQPGFDDPDIHIRGVVTTGNNEPLIVVDGVKRDNIRQVDPAMIESVTILKDAAAVAPYGIGGANGVILITTKKGQAGRPVVRLTSSYGVQNPTYLPKMLSAKDYMALQNEGYYNLTPNGTTPPNNADLIANYDNLHKQDPDLYPDSKFIDFWNTNVPVQNYNLEFSGGTDMVNYHAGIGYYDQGGIFDKVGYKRYSYNMSLGIQATNTTKVTMSLNGSIEDTKTIDPGDNLRDHLFRAFYKFVPTSAMMYSDGEHWGESSASSPIAALRSDGYDVYNRNTLLSSITLEQELPFIKGLNFKGVFSFDPSNQRRKRWHIPFTYDVINYSTTPYSFTTATTTQEGNSPLYSYLRLDNERWFNYTYQAYLTYNRSFGDHTFGGLIVAEARNSTYDTFWTQRNNFALYIDEMDFGSSNKNDYSNGGRSSTGSEIGYVYRVTYSYKDRYMFEASGRYDGHYYFAPGKRWGYFPAFSAAWRISEESFMAGLENVDNLKLRASWGQSGMLAGSAFQYLSGYTLRGNAYAFGGAGALVQGSRNSQESNPNITWERSTKLDIGFDLNMWNGLFNLEFDYFHENRTDMLLAPQVTLPVEYGLSLSQENKGEMKNNGFELNAGSNYNVNKDLRIGITGNFSYAKNQMIEVFQTQDQANNPNRTRVGKPFGTPFGYQALGLFTTAEDKNGDGIINAADGYNVQQFGDVHPGDVKYADLSGPDGVPDGKIDSNDETKIGYPLYPLLTYGFTPTLDWKGLDVSLFFQGAAMATINTYQFQTVPFENNGSNTAYEYFDNRWTPQNQNAKYPRATPSPYANNNNASTFWYYNTGYLRLKTVIIGYTLPKSVTDKLGIAGVRVYATGQNMLTFSQLKHVDPEMGYNARETAYPVMKSTTFGIDITF